MKRFSILSMDGIGVALRSVLCQVKEATNKRPSVSVRFSIKYLLLK